MYKTILVHIDETSGSAHRTAVAARFALRAGAHLVGAAMTGVPPYLLPGGAAGFGVEPMHLPMVDLRAQARQALARFEQAARGAGVVAPESRCIDEESGVGISMLARFSDLVVISQAVPGDFLLRQRPDFPDYVVLNSPSPVLVLPAAPAGAAIGERVTLAWNGSAQAARAIHSALPLLQQARRVDLVVFDAAISSDLHGEEAGADLAAYLARHGVDVRVSSRMAPGGEGKALLDFAGEMESDLIVMGAYGHSRFREIILGGMTRTMLATSTIPLWMAH